MSPGEHARNQKNIDSFPVGRDAGVTPGSDYNERRLQPMSSASLKHMPGKKLV